MKKGFTLIEVLAVIVLMGVLLTFLLPRLFDFSKKTESELYDAKIEKIENAAISYGNDRIDALSIEPKIIKVSELLELGYLKNSSDAVNPINDKSMEMCEIEITYAEEKLYVEFIKNQNIENYNESCGNNEIEK